jgi:hypothetical protein
MTSLRNLLFILILTTVTSISFAQAGSTFYVSTSGSDSNSGSASAPWKTIQHAASTVTAGATVIVESGTYHESVTFSNSGTSSEPIVFNGQGVAIVDGSTGVACCTTPTWETSNNFLCCNTQGLFNVQNFKQKQRSCGHLDCRQRKRDQHS